MALSILCRCCRQPFEAQRRSAKFCSDLCRLRHHRNPARLRKIVDTPNADSVSGLRIVPLTFREANEAVARWHRHHRPIHHHRVSVGITNDGELCGAAIIGRPAARQYDPRIVCEVSRLVTDGEPHCASKLYAACARIAREMGFREIQTYIQANEPGTSLRAAGWTYADDVTVAHIHRGQRIARQRWVKKF